MNFTSDIKKELINYGFPRGKAGLAEKKSALSAFLRTSGFLGEYEGSPSFFIVSETENVAEYFMSIFSDVFSTELVVTHATVDRMSGKGRLLIQCPAQKAEEVLKTLGLLKKTGGIREGIASACITDEVSKIAYLKGAFLGGGSCILPSEGAKTSYHLEIVFYDKRTAQDFCDIMTEFELIMRIVERKDTCVVYIKSKEMISDFLSVIGAEHSLRHFSALVKKRDEANRDNRKQNCMAGNADKTAIAAVKQVVAIERLKKTSVYNDLSEELKALAEARILHPAISLQELADLLKISKSCLNHRMRRLMELAQQTE